MDSWLLPVQLHPGARSNPYMPDRLHHHSHLQSHLRSRRPMCLHLGSRLCSYQHPGIPAKPILMLLSTPVLATRPPYRPVFCQSPTLHCVPPQHSGLLSGLRSGCPCSSDLTFTPWTTPVLDLALNADCSRFAEERRWYGAVIELRKFWTGRRRIILRLRQLKYKYDSGCTELKFLREGPKIFHIAVNHTFKKDTEKNC